MRSPHALLALVAVVALSLTGCPREDPTPPAPPAATLTGVGPRTISNQTAMPVSLYGRGFAKGQRLRLGSPYGKELPLVVDDATHAHALIPAGLEVGARLAEVSVPLTLVDENGAALGEPVDLVIVNDTGYVDVLGLVASADGRFAFTASHATDELLALDTTSGVVTRVPVADGPWAIARAVLDGAERVVVAHRYAPTLAIVDVVPGADGARAVRQVPGPRHAHALVVDGATAYVGEHAHDQLVAIDLATGAVAWRADVAPNPRGIAVVPAARDGAKGTAPLLAVGSLIAGETTLVRQDDGRVVHRGVAPRPLRDGVKNGVEILGGHTESYADRVIGGKGVRALATVVDGGKPWVLVASAGPNVGPNGDQMGVTTVGGVGVIHVDPGDASGSSYARHLAFNFGVPQAFAHDDARRRLYVADVGQGLVHVVDTQALLAKDAAKARGAWLSSTPLPLPPKFPLFRPAEDFGVDGAAELRDENATLDPRLGGKAVDASVKSAHPVVEENKRRRAGVEVHTGPSGLALVDGGKKLLVLERFTGRVTRLDVSGAAPVVETSWVLFDALVQPDRRLGQVLYFADMGRTGMTCDVCHLEGHTEGVFFTKTGMMRIWRSSTLRGVRDTPPFFNPPGHATIEDTCSFVGSRNRFQNPPLTDEETRRLAIFTRTFTNPPNPFRAPDGGHAETVALDGGRTGSPAKGRRIFESRCAGCHPAPLFSSDQDEATRRRFMKVGTPSALEIRVEQQDTSFVHRTPPSLVGAWDNWPMLLSASAGFAVSSEGPFLEAKDHSALRAVLERYAPRPHGDAMALDPAQRADLEAYVQSL